MIIITTFYLTRFYVIHLAGKAIIKEKHREFLINILI